MRWTTLRVIPKETSSPPFLKETRERRDEDAYANSRPRRRVLFTEFFSHTSQRRERKEMTLLGFKTVGAGKRWALLDGERKCLQKMRIPLKARVPRYRSDNACLFGEKRRARSFASRVSRARMRHRKSKGMTQLSNDSEKKLEQVPNCPTVQRSKPRSLCGETRRASDSNLESEILETRHFGTGAFLRMRQRRCGASSRGPRSLSRTRHRVASRPFTKRDAF